MRLIARRKADQNHAAIDPWTAVHLAAGLALGLMEVPWRRALGAALVYEAVEQIAERRDWGQELFETSGPESLSNAVVDTVVLVIGHRLGGRWNRT